MAATSLHTPEQQAKIKELSDQFAEAIRADTEPFGVIDGIAAQAILKAHDAGEHYFVISLFSLMSIYEAVGSAGLHEAMGHTLRFVNSALAEIHPERN